MSVYMGPRGFYSTEKSRKKFFRASVFYFHFALICVWIPTLRLWLAENEDPHFYTAYSSSCVTILIFGMFVNYHVQHEDFYIGLNRLLYYFPRFMAKWMKPIAQKKLQKITSIMNVVVFLAIIVHLLLALPTLVFYIVSPDHPMHSRQLLPKFYGLNEHIITTIIFLTLTTWMSTVSWFTVMWIVVMGTLYISSSTILNCTFRNPVLNTRELEYIKKHTNTDLVVSRASANLFGLGFDIGESAKIGIRVGVEFVRISNIVRQTLKAIILTIWSIVFQVIWAFTVEVSGSFHSYSGKVLKSWETLASSSGNNSVKRKYFKKFMLSVKPIGIGVEEKYDGVDTQGNSYRYSRSCHSGLEGWTKRGLSQRQIWTKYKLARTTIQTIIKNFKANGSVQNKVRSGRKPILARREVRHVLNKVNVTTSLSAPKLSTEIKEMFGKQSSPEASYCTEECNQTSEVCQRPHFQATNILGHILWTDESKFNVFGSDGRRRVWRYPKEALNPKNLNPTVKHGGGSVMVWGCMASSGAGKMEFIDGIMDQYKNLFENLDLDDDLPSNKTTIRNTLPSPPWNTSRKKNSKLEWPPQSPDLNPIEHLWDHIEREIRKQSFSGIPGLKSRIREVWETISEDVTKNLVNSMTRRLEAVLKANGGPTKY
ncbi:Transposable element Tc1 transposase [Folsomia candida]|uniref:Transposable element Tc1 transposase n=1 Tax=Folsomia candida TaxID=158441 RepID=A0A226D674_FOLCA|nr:Transposable element Tc1 transposase [Folsomia candida]